MKKQKKRTNTRNKIKKSKKKNFIQLDTEKLYESVSNGEITEDEFREIINNFKNGRSYYKTKTITSGPIREIEIYPVFPEKDIPNEYRLKATKEAQRNFKHKNAKKYFERKINTNFGKGDYYVTLNYEKGQEPKDHEEAQKNIQNYVRRLRYFHNKNQDDQGIPKKEREELEYIYVNEISKEGKGRHHHHIIINSVITMEVIEKKWKHGRRNNIRVIHPDEEHITGLSKYLAKDPKGKKRWGCSKGLRDPDITTHNSKFSNKKVNEMALNYNQIEEEMEKTNPGYKFMHVEVSKNEFNGRWYMYSRMRKIE